MKHMKLLATANAHYTVDDVKHYFANVILYYYDENDQIQEKFLVQDFIKEGTRSEALKRARKVRKELKATKYQEAKFI